MHARLAVARRELPRAVRIAVAATLAWWIARLLGADRPVFAVIVPMVAIRDDTHAALSLSLGRMLGVMAGVVLGIGVVAVAGVSTSAVILLLVVGPRDRALPAHRPRAQHADRDLGAARAGRDQGTPTATRSSASGRPASARSCRSPSRRSCCRPIRSADSTRRLAGSARALAGDLADARGTLERGDPSARVLLTHADEHARAAGRAVEDLPRAQRALRMSPLRRGSRTQLDVVDRRQRLALRLAIQVRRLARDLASFAHRDDLRDEWEAAARRPAADHRGDRGGDGQGARGRGLLARGRRGARAHRDLPARRQPPGRGDPAPAGRPARRRARGAPRVSTPVPAGEDAEVAALRVLARRLGVADDVRLLSPWTPLPPIAGGDAGRLSGAADLLLRFSPVPVLGVTGSAGKTTTARLAEAMLRASGVEVLTSDDAPADNAWPTAALVERVLAARPPAWCVAELTSNHLAVCSASPRIACITNVWPDHVDQHGSLAAYLEAKRRIVAFQRADDWVVVNADDPGAVELAARLGGPRPARRARRARRAIRARASRRGGSCAGWTARCSTSAPRAPCPRRRARRRAAGAAAARSRGRDAGRRDRPRALAGWTGLALRREHLGVVDGSPGDPRRAGSDAREGGRGARTAPARLGRPDRRRLRRPRRRPDARRAGSSALPSERPAWPRAPASTPRCSAPPARGSPPPWRPPASRA